MWEKDVNDLNFSISSFHYSGGTEGPGSPALGFCLSRAGSKLIKGSFTKMWWKSTTTTSWTIDANPGKSGSLMIGSAN